MLTDVWAIGREAHPTIVLPQETFVTAAPALLPSLSKAPDGNVLTHAADVYLVVGCLLDFPAALSTIEKGFFSRIPGFVLRIDNRPEFTDEVTQRLRARLLAAPDRKLTEYGAGGPLLAWMRIAALRLAIDLRRAAGGNERRMEAEPNWERLAAATEPEWELLRARYREPLELAIRSGVSTLSPQERMVLRLYLFGGQNIADIGKTYNVHRSTVARWITAAQDKIVAFVRAELGARFGIDAKDCDSLARALYSNLDVSLSGLL